MSEEEPHERVTRVEHTTPLWRLLGVLALFGALGAIGHYLDVVGHVEDFSTVLVITVAFTVSFWAHKHPRRLEERLGPFGKIGAAIAESQDDLRTWVHERTLLAGALIAVCYGVLVVIAKHVVVYFLTALYNPWLAVAGGLAVGAAVIAPELFRAIGRSISGQR